MDLVDKQHIVLFERGQDTREVARLIEYRTGGNLKSYPQLVGDDIRERGLSQARRTVQQGMIQRLTTILGSLHEHLKVLYDLLLTTEITECQRSQCVLKVFFSLRKAFFAYIEIVIHHNLPAKLRKKPQITKNLWPFCTSSLFNSLFCLSHASSETASREAASATAPGAVATPA